MRWIDSGKPPQVSAQELQGLTEHAARCPDCASGKPATASSYPLHLGIGDDLEKALRVFAESHGLSVSAAVRLILHERLTTSQPEEIQR